MATTLEISYGTAIEWTDTSTSGDYELDCGGLAADGVAVGEQGDLGATRERWYRWVYVCDGFTASGTVGERIDIYLARSDGTYEDGNVGTSAGSGSTVALPNLLPLGTAVVQTTTADDDIHASGLIQLGARYVSPVIHNKTGNTHKSASDAHRFFLYPVVESIVTT